MRSSGRYIVMSSKFLDPTIFRAGMKITVAGQVAGKKTMVVDQTNYTYPVVAVKQLVLWRISYYAYPYDYWDYWPSFYGPYWGPGGWGPYWDYWSW